MSLPRNDYGVSTLFPYLSDDALLTVSVELQREARRRYRPDRLYDIAAWGSSILIGGTVGMALVGRLAEWLAQAVESGGLL